MAWRIAKKLHRSGWPTASVDTDVATYARASPGAIVAVEDATGRGDSGCEGCCGAQDPCEEGV